jgi:hypothetical protein
MSKAAILAALAALAAATGCEDAGKGEPDRARVTTLPAFTKTASGRKVKLGVRRPDEAERGGDAETCTSAWIGDEGDSRECGPRRLAGLLGGALAFDCDRNEATLFGRVRAAVRDMHSRARVDDAPLALARGGPDPRALVFALPLDTRDLPAEVDLLDRDGASVKRVPVYQPCGDATLKRSVLPVGVPVD